MTRTESLYEISLIKRKGGRDFHGGPVVRNPPANAKDTGLILGLGGFHMMRNNSACVP